MNYSELAVGHLLLRLRPIHRALRFAVSLQSAAAARLDRPELASVCVTDNQVANLLDDVDRLICTDEEIALESAPLSDEELAAERSYREAAASQGDVLPIDHLTETLELCRFEQEVLIICAVAEWDQAYERIFAYIVDDLAHKYASVELVCNLAAKSVRQRMRRRQMVGRFGRLRRCGLIETCDQFTTEAHRQLRLGMGVLDFLCGFNADAAGMWHDPADVGDRAATRCAQPMETAQLQKIGQALADHSLAVIGIWGHARAVNETAQALACSAGMPLRRLSTPWLGKSIDPEASIREQVFAAAAVGAALQVPVDLIADPQQSQVAHLLDEILSRCAVPTFLTGAEPCRPTRLLAARAYVEIELPAATYRVRQAMWREILPECGRMQLDDLASRFRISRPELSAAVRFARTQAWLDSNGTPALVGDKLEAACAAVARTASCRFLTLVKPRRGPDDLILPADLHRQVMEIARFSRVLPHVSESWGFGRLATGGSGIKALFTGDSGTGKTLAAEVIAAQLGLPLMKINIAQTLSQWIGETEKHLDEAFAQAAASHVLLFIDEADALCGKRGEVRHGSDRYANTAVSHLLQRLEDFDGLVVMASNLKDNIDPAFLRRFQVILHFPRPSERDRQQMWRLAFPPEAPLDAQVDLVGVAQLDMTGAGIFGAARTAALLAADQEVERISMTHLVQGIVRQFSREGRVLAPTALGRHAGLMQGP